ncbi:MAG: DUF3102 domain-containing protein [Acidobacterium ailaaui]|nr:DUF3102 domain-containing protein [Pseudacidobacterium ailaaui]
MHEIATQLSNDINVITAEINAYKQVAGEAIFEIGRRLKEVRDNHKKYGLKDYRDWEKWCNEKVQMSRTHANRFIKIYEELEPTWVRNQNLGTRVLYEIAALPPEERDKPHTIPSTGEVKTVDEMTVRELREVKAALKREREARLKAEEEAKKPPRIEWREKIVDKTDYAKIERLESELEQKQKEIELLHKKLQLQEKDIQDADRLKRELKSLMQQRDDIERQIESAVSLSSLYVEIEHFLQTKLAPIKYSRALTERRDSRVVIENLRGIIEMVEAWVHEMKRYLPDHNIIDVEVSQ